MTKRILLTSVLALVVSAGCAEKKQLEEMHDSTAQMKDTTLKMSDNMTDLKTKTGQMKGMTDELYDALRQGNSVQLRREAMNSLLQTSTMFGKISEAGKYFMSFELQLWNLNGQDLDQSKRDILAQQAAQEFFLEVEGLAPREGLSLFAKPDGAHITSTENRAAAFNALAVAIQEINRKQIPVLKQRPELEKISMLSLMEEALLSKKALNQGTLNLGTKTGYIREILVHETKAIQILQTRLNLFPLIFIDQVSGINDKNILVQAKRRYLGWDLDMNKLNSEQLAYLQEKVLQPALDAKALLKKLEVSTKLDSNVAGLLRNMKVISNDKASASMAASRVKLLEMVTQLQKP